MLSTDREYVCPAPTSVEASVCSSLSKKPVVSFGVSIDFRSRDAARQCASYAETLQVTQRTRRKHVNLACPNASSDQLF